MKEITAIIQSHMLGRVIDALHALPHFPGLTVLDAHGQGRGRGAGAAFKPTEENFAYHKKTLLLVMCDSSMADAVVTAIMQNARTGHHGDGIVTVKSVENVLRIRTGESAQQAL
jgi:nitrogen regulatory protein P-II 1